MHRTLATRLALLVTLVATCFLPASAQTTYTQRNVPSSTYPTIQSAIDAAASGTVTPGTPMQTGDTILVAPGNYPENLDFRGKNITVQATSTDATQTTITGTNPGLPTVQFVTGEGRFSILQGFTITAGGGNASTGAAGGVYIHGATPTLRGNIITRNTCFGIYSEGGSPAILGDQINNTLYAPGAPCNIGAGSAIWLDNASGPLIASSRPLIVGNTIQQNSSSGLSPGGGGGAAILVQNVESPIIQNNVLLNNTTTGAGGAIQITGASYLYLSGNLIVGNQSGSHGAIAIMIPAANTGLGPPASLILNNTVTGNTVVPIGSAAPDDGSEIYLEGDLSRTVISGNIVAGSSSTLPAFACGLISDSLSPLPPVLDHNDITNTQSAGAFGGSALCSSQAGVTGNLSVDPAFVSTNPASADFHLRTGSPAIDAGITSAIADLIYSGLLPLRPDLDGNPRVLDSTSVGYPVLDLGAYEAQGATDSGITTLALTSSAYRVAGQGTPILTANVYTSAQTTPPGPVSFSEDGKPLGPTTTAPVDPASATAVLTTPPLVPGLHTFTAAIPAQNGTSPAISVKAFILVDPYPTNLVLTCPASPAAAGAPVSFGITLTSANGTPPNATVSLFDNGSTTPFDTVQLSPAGTYTYTTSILAVGSHSIVAAYAGTPLYQAVSSAPCALTIAAATGAATTTTVSGNPNPAPLGQPVTFTVQVTDPASPTGPFPGGTVSLTLGKNTIFAPPKTLSASGSATFSLSTLPVGSNTITATYTPAPPPATAFAPSSGSTTETIVGAQSTTSLNASPNPANAQSPVLLSATVAAASGSPTPTGTVNFFDGPTLIGTSPLANGQATLTARFSANPSSHPLTAVYSGNTSLASSTSAVINEIINAIPTSTTLTVTPSQSVAFQPVSLSTHTVALTPGAPPINSSSGAAPSITFFSNGVTLGTAPVDASGNAALTVTPPAGSYIITATFSGSAVFTQSASNAATLAVTALVPALTLTGSPTDAVVGQTVSLTATLNALGAPPAAISGTVSFFDGGTPLGSSGLNASGIATLNFSPLSPGTHLITAHYSGNTTLTPADASLTLNVSARDFLVTTSTPSISIRTEHHAPLTVTVTSVGGLVDIVDLSCSNLPQWTSCTFKPGSLGIGQAGTSQQSASTRLTLDTDFVLGYARLDSKPPTRSRGPAPIAFALLLPAAVLLLWRRRIPLPRLLLLALLSAATFTASGCSGLYPPHTAPGTYTITISGHAGNNNITRSTTLTLVVTP